MSQVPRRRIVGWVILVLDLFLIRVWSERLVDVFVVGGSCEVRGYDLS